MLRLITTLALLFCSVTSYADFVQDRDLISLHYDHAPDRDDGHATVSALAVVRSLGITPHVVSGAYGQHNADRYQPPAVDVMRAAWGSAWLDAHANRQSSVNATATRWRNVLVNGGDIWVAEGGQSDFTADVVRSIQNTNPGINTRNRIHVVQHSVWNEEQSNQGDLNYSRANTDYTRIADGNGVNATADLNQRSDSFVALARASQFGAAWNAAFNYLNPNNKLDFSDTVELLHILDIGTDRIATVNDFAAVFIDNTPTPLATSPTAWSDSYSVNGQCYCDTNFDHGLNSVSVDTPAGRRTVPQICADITSTFGTGSFNNRVYFNTVQCGHGPANNAADETVCPGIPRGLNNYTGSRCNQTGATWNLDALYATPEPTPEPVAAPIVETTPEPVPVTEAAPASTTATIAGFPVCSTASVDDNGDGFGFENNQSCIVAGSTAAMVAAQAPQQTAQTAQQTEQTTQTVAPIDNPLINFPVCSSSLVDDNGDGYGWENNQTCVVANSAAAIAVATTTPTASQNVAPVDNPSINFPTCSSSAVDDNGDGYGWENNQTCVVANSAAAAAVATTTPTASQNVAPIDNPLINFPVCSSSSVDDNGDGYGWENNQTCVVANSAAATALATAQPAVSQNVAPNAAPIDNPLLDFPVCSSSAFDDDGDGFGWENNQTCVVDR